MNQDKVIKIILTKDFRMKILLLNKKTLQKMINKDLINQKQSKLYFYNISS